MLKAFSIGIVISLCVAGCAAQQARQTAPASATAHSTAAPCIPAGALSRPTDTTVKCGSGPGRSFTRDDVSRTGQLDMGRALQMLDPSIAASGR
jgi:hypothetical protein